MKSTRFGSMVALAAASVLTLAACGTDDNTVATTEAPAASSAPVESSAEAGTSAASSDSSEEESSAAGSSAAGESSSAPAGGDLTFEGAGFTCATGELRSSGSSAQGKAMGQWITDYNDLCGAGVNEYGGGGSGKGRTDFVSNQTDFGGSDSAMKDDQREEAKTTRCDGNEAINLPMLVGPIALAYNLDGVDNLVLDADVLSGIFGGTITTWNDPAIAALNDGVELPAEAIQSVHRSEDSGTTDNFTKYLAAAGTWEFEAGQAWVAPGGIGAQGSDGVAKSVSTTAGSIGYVEWGFARDNSLNIAQIDSGNGAVELTGESAGLALAAAEIVGEGNNLALELDYATDEAGAYPIVLVTYQVLCSAGNGDVAETLKSFMGYIATDGQATLESVGAAPLPAEIQEKVVAAALTIA